MSCLFWVSIETHKSVLRRTHLTAPTVLKQEMNYKNLTKTIPEGHTYAVMWFGMPDVKEYTNIKSWNINVDRNELRMFHSVH